MIDIVQILVNLNDSLNPIQQMITGGAYVMGVFFMFKGVGKLKVFGAQRAYFRTTTESFSALGYMFVGSVLLFMPTWLQTMNQTLYGYGNPLSYGGILDHIAAEFMDVKKVVVKLVQIVGLIWFVVGFTLIAKASEPGKQEGGKGIAFMAAGIIGINITGTVEVMSYTMNFITSGGYTFQPPSVVK